MATGTESLAKDSDAQVVMTLRVSRDSGRSWGPTTAVRVDGDRVVPIGTGAFPPCMCQRCTACPTRTAL